MIFYCVADELHGIRKAFVITGCKGAELSGVTSFVVEVIPDGCKKLPPSMLNATPYSVLLVFTLIVCMIVFVLEWYVTRFGNIDHKAADSLNEVVEE